jgi:hypothetical protein
MMTILAMTAMLVGAVLGMRFKVLILAPAFLIGSVTILGTGLAQNNSLWSILLGMVLVMAALQMGYLAGTVIRFVIAGARVRKRLPATIAVLQKPTR